MNTKTLVLTVYSDNKTTQITTKKGMSLFDVLMGAGLYCESVCNGNGSCGKCTVKILKGNTDVSAADKKFFSQKQIDMGYRLACTYYLNENTQIEIKNKNSDFFILSADVIKEKVSASEYKIAVDIGTTTLALALVSKNSKSIVTVNTTINPQIKYGADVISRINAGISGKKDELKSLIVEALKKSFYELCIKTKIEYGSVSEIIIACNTAMCHLLMGYDCKPLGEYPFKPFYTGFVQEDYKSVFGEDSFCARVTVLPAISAYVGADIVSGLYYTDFCDSSKNNIFLDLGTNGEIALGKKNRVLVCSAAAGPAFEGGNISCGTGSVSGAISTVEISNGNVAFTTINNTCATGICGTGVIETVAELLKNNIIDETGLLCDNCFDSGFVLYGKNNIVFTQNDVRQVQLAKSAVCSAIDTLLHEAGICDSDVDCFYLAGGFGTKLNAKKAASIGLFSHVLAKKAVTPGNTSLLGVVKYAFDYDGKAKVQKIVSLCREVMLASNPVFNEGFVENMLF